MTIGRQFENTFWEDPTTGDTHTWTRNGDVPRPIHVVNPTGEQRKPLQGLLFHPLTGTGLSGDPMNPPEVRRGVIQKALDLVDVGRYKQNLRSTLGKQTRRSKRGVPTRADISDATAEAHMRRLADTLEQSEMPTHMIASRVDKPVPTILDPIPGRAWAETGGRSIRMTMPKAPALRTVTSVEKVKTPSNEPIANPKFWEQLDRARRRVSYGEDHGPKAADDAFNSATHWVNPTTGHVMTMEEAEKLPRVEDSGSDTPGEFLREWGYVPNLFPGKGKPESVKHAVGENVKIETGFGDWERGRDYTSSTFHQRFKPGVEEERTVTRTTRVEAPLSESTMTHELGHAMDVNISDRLTHRGDYVLSPGRITHWIDPSQPGRRWEGGTAKWHRGAGRTPVRGADITAIADPMEEAVADAFADRYTRYKGQFSDTLANPEARVRDFARTGYSTGYSGWKNDLHRALYVATRYHTALSDDQAQQIPSRESLLKALPKEESRGINKMDMNINEYLDTANKLALGHIWHHMPHIRGVVRQAGYEKAALEAHDEYKKRMRLDAWKQPTLPGMEDFV